MFSRPVMIEASKKFVRIRLNPHEHKDHVDLLLKLRAVSGDPEFLINNDFFLLDPTGEKVLFRKGARPYPDFMKEAGGLPGILAEMRKAAWAYPGKAPQSPLVPWNKSLTGALLRAHADTEPALLLIGDGGEESKALEKLLGDPALLQRFRAEFYFVRLDKGSKEIATHKLPQACGLLLLRPSRLGTEAVVMDTKADPKDLARSMAAALDEFARTFPKRSRDETLDIGRKEKIEHPIAGKGPEPFR